MPGCVGCWRVRSTPRSRRRGWQGSKGRPGGPRLARRSPGRSPDCLRRWPAVGPSWCSTTFTGPNLLCWTSWSMWSGQQPSPVRVVGQHPCRQQASPLRHDHDGCGRNVRWRDYGQPGPMGFAGPSAPVQEKTRTGLGSEAGCSVASQLAPEPTVLRRPYAERSCRRPPGPRPDREAGGLLATSPDALAAS